MTKYSPRKHLCKAHFKHCVHLCILRIYPPNYAPTQYVAPAYGAQQAPAYVPPQQPRRSRRGLWIALAIIGGLIVLSCGVCGILFATGVGFFAKSVALPAITVNQYYSSVEKQD